MSNEKQRSAFTTVVGIVLTAVGALITFVGGSALLSTTWDFIGILVLLLTLAGLLLLVSGISQLFIARDVKEKQHQIMESLHTKPAEGDVHTSISNQPVRAHWPIDEATWKLFAKNEIKYRNEDNIYFSIAFFALGTITIMLSRSASLPIAIIITLIIGSIIVYIRRKLALAKLKPGKGKKEVYITDYFVILNGEQYYLMNEHRLTSKVILYEDTSPAILEFTIHWQTRNGVTFDELRLPVPPEAIPLAKEISLNFKTVNLPR
ncbi:MAG TPA: hypothetical protein PLJ00_17250 [Chitinophagales bacterium]|nr:hypothetical protein [Chitinophagales bacterium]